MSFLSDIEKATTRPAILSFLALLLFFVPGVTVVFTYFPELFASLETVKVLMLSAAFVMPTFLVVFLVAGTKTAETLAPGNDFHFFAVTLSSMYTGLAMYVALGFSYWRGYSFDQFVWCQVLMTIVAVALGLLVNWIGGLEEKDKQ